MFNLAAFLEEYAAWVPLFIFCARICDVSLGTLRTICVVRGVRFVAACLGFAEVTIWIVAVSSVITNLNRPLNVVAYAAGFATGNWVGMWLETWMAFGEQIVRLISGTRGHSLAYALRLSGGKVFAVPGRSHEGPVTICFVAAARREVPSIIRTARQVDPDVFVTIEDARETSLRSHRAILARRGRRFRAQEESG